MQGPAPVDGSKHGTFRALVEYYAKTYSAGQVANQLCDIMEGLSAPVHARAVQWTIDAVRKMSEERGFWKQDCLQALDSIRSAAVSYFQRQKVEPTDDVLFDIVQAVVLEFAVVPSG